MIRTRLASLALLAFLAMLPAGARAAGADPVGECDRLAASPHDPQKVGPGVANADLQAEPAIAACRAAVAAEPKTPRLLYQFGRALDRAGQLPEAAEWYRRASDAGHAVARSSLGNMYETGDGVPQDYAQAVALYRSAMPDDPWSFGYLAHLYDEGLGVKQDYAEAMRLYRQGSAVGDSWSDMKIGYMYEKGHGVSADAAEALRWYQRAADGGDGTGLLDVGVFYEMGIAVTADPAKAADYYKRAIAAGQPIGYHHLGALYAEGRGVPHDEAEAERLWQQGVDKGDWQSENALAYAWADKGQNLEAALKLVDEALAKAPEDGNSLDTRGWTLFRLGRLDEAVPALQAALGQDRHDPAVVHDHLGEAYAARGDQAKARSEWEVALRLGPAPALEAALKKKLGGGTE
jgi:TPR repeat protein